MSKTWIDLTDIELWSGHHGGTQRVVYGIAKNYYLNDTDVHFFTYSPIKDGFYETSFAPIYERVENLTRQTRISDAFETSLKHRLKRKFLHHAPAYVKNNKKLKNNIKFVTRSTLNVAKKVNNLRLKQVDAYRKKMPHIPNTSPISFRSDDVVLILGKPWDNPGLQKLVMKQKTEVNFKVVQVVYDLIISLYPHLHHPSLFKSYTQHMFDAVTVSDLMLPISHSSDNDLKKFCKMLSLPIPKTSVIRIGDEIELPEDLNTINKPDECIDDAYILCVGTIENRKNHLLLYQTYKLAQQRGIELPQLIIAGGRGWLADDVQYLITHDPSVSKKIHILYSPTDSVLAWLYKNCLFTVYPSLYEGWGLPVAESLAHGKVCVSSNISSMPEIAGDMLTYFSPYSTDDCLTAITNMTNKDIRAKAEERILKEYKTTSWKSTYDQVVRTLVSS